MIYYLFEVPRVNANGLFRVHRGIFTMVIQSNIATSRFPTNRVTNHDAALAVQLGPTNEPTENHSGSIT